MVCEQDDDPTAELKLLSDEVLADDEPGQQVEAESDAITIDFERLVPEIDHADETIATLKLDLQSRAESISKLQFDIEQLRSRWTGLEKEIKVREEVTDTLTADLKLAHRNQSKTKILLRQREEEIESLTSKLFGQEQSLEESARQIEQARKDEQESESRVLEIQTQLDAAEDKLAALTEESLAGRLKQEETSIKVRTLSREVAGLQKELAASHTSVSELQQYVDGRKACWDEQQKQLIANKEKINRLSAELVDTDVRLQEGGTAYDDLNDRLASLRAERDDLRREITQLLKEGDGAAIDRKKLVEQTGMLAGRNFQISELRNQIARTETYADELRRQLQDRLALTVGLQTRQKHLQISLSRADAQVRELSNGVDELRSSDTLLREKISSLKEEFDREVRQIRFELVDAQGTIADRESLTEQLTSDLENIRESNMKLENCLGSAEEENKATIAKLKRKLANVEALNDELRHTLSIRDNTISALLGEMTKKSEAIESIGEIEDVIHDRDDRISERIENRGSVERQRITRLLIGKIDGQKLRFPLFKNRLTIGRTGHNDIQLKAAFISRRHAVIVSDDNGTRIVDWGSKNGVFVNTNRIKEQILRNGDIVTFGKADFKFEERRKR